MIGFMALLFTVMIIGLGILGVAAGLRRIGPPRAAGGADEAGGRLDRIETAIGVIEARLDDLQEQQRFLERLLESKPDAPSLGPGGADRPTDEERSILFDTEPGDAEEER